MHVLSIHTHTHTNPTPTNSSELRGAAITPNAHKQANKVTTARSRLTGQLSGSTFRKPACEGGLVLLFFWSWIRLFFSLCSTCNAHSTSNSCRERLSGSSRRGGQGPGHVTFDCTFLLKKTLNFATNQLCNHKTTHTHVPDQVFLFVLF